MYTVNLISLDQTSISTGANSNKIDYYLGVILSELKECLNSNAISYSENDQNTNQNSRSGQIVNLSIGMNTRQPSDSNNKPDILINFDPGNPESKRLATIFEKNFNNLYSPQKDIKIFSTQKNNILENDIPSIAIEIDYSNDDAESWLSENIELLSKSIILSLCEYFAIPFIGCGSGFIGIADEYATIFAKPYLTSDVLGNVEKNSKVNINSQWEDWYIVGENGNLGYVQTKFIRI